MTSTTSTSRTADLTRRRASGRIAVESALDFVRACLLENPRLQAHYSEAHSMMWSHILGALKGRADSSTDAQLGAFVRGVIEAHDSRPLLDLFDEVRADRLDREG